MKVIAIDPGYDRIGVAIIEGSIHSPILTFSTCLTTSKSDDLPSRIHELGTALTAIIHTYKPDALAIETLFFNKNVKTAIGVAQARGAIIYIGKSLGCTIYEFSPQEVKIATTGHGASQKADVIAMTKRLVKGVPANALDDEYDAIAVGIACLAHYR